MEIFADGMGNDVLWIVILGFIIAFVLAIALGANDVANSFGTSVGAKVLTLGQACVIAALFETLGALIVGSRVSETIRKGIFDPTIYEGNEELLMVGNLCALLGSCIWLFVATWLKLPVSASHSIVGATLGFHFVVFFDQGVDWAVIVKIALSWVVSPVLSGIISGSIFMIIKYTILIKKDPLTPGLISQPIWFLIVMFVNLFAITFGSPYIPPSMRVWVSIVTGIGAGLVTAAIVFWFLVPRVRKKILDAREREETEERVNKGLDPLPSENTMDGKTPLENGKHDTHIQMKSLQDDHEEKITKLADEPNGVIVPNGHALDPHEGPTRRFRSASQLEKIRAGSVRSNASGVSGRSRNRSILIATKEAPGSAKTGETVSIHGIVVANDPAKNKYSDEWQAVRDPPEVHAICSPLQVLSASFAAFSHGGNDVSNAIGPLVSIWIIYQTGMVSQEAKVDYWILLYGAAGITVGLFWLGRRVIETVGEDLTPMTPSNGFSIELGSAATVLLASNLGIPVSTTHCKVGSVCAVGWLRSRSAVDWRLFSGIFLAWVVTLPASIGLSAAFMGILQHTVPSTCGCIPYELMTTDFTTSMTTLL